MSTRHMTVPIQVVPDYGTYLQTTGSGYWADSDWTELFASAPNDILIHGFGTYDQPGGLNTPMEMEFAVGAEGEEERIHTYRFIGMYGVNTPHCHCMFPVPLAGFSAGDRISWRICSYLATNGHYQFMYSENNNTQHKLVGRSKCWPYRADDTFVIWNNSAPWANSDWYDLGIDTAGVENTIVDIFHRPTGPLSCGAEMDISIGLPGEEHLHILTTKRWRQTPLSGYVHQINFPGGLPISPDTRLTYRIRRAETMPSISSVAFSFNYVYDTHFIS